MVNRTRGRGRGAGRQARRPIVPHNEGRFHPAPMDPPPAFKSGWKAIRLEESLGSTDVTLTTGNIRDALNVLGISANSVKLMKVAVWVNPGTAANQNVPQVILSLQDPVGKGSLGTRTDTGQLSRAAKLAYSYSDTVRETALDLPSQGSAGITLGVIAASAASGVFQISLLYNI